LFHKCGKARCGCGERMCRSGGPGKEARKHGAGDRRGEDRRFAGSSWASIAAICMAMAQW